MDSCETILKIVEEQFFLLAKAVRENECRGDTFLIRKYSSNRKKSHIQFGIKRDTTTTRLRRKPLKIMRAISSFKEGSSLSPPGIRKKFVPQSHGKDFLSRPESWAFRLGEKRGSIILCHKS